MNTFRAEDPLIDKDNFDPVFRKRDFIKVKRQVLGSLELRRKTRAEILKMRQQASQREETLIRDEDQLDFMSEDPRKEKIDLEQ